MRLSLTSKTHDSINTPANNNPCRHKAEQLLQATQAEPAITLPFYEKLAGFYEKSRQFDQAERGYIKAGKPQRAVVLSKFVFHILAFKGNVFPKYSKRE